MAKYIPVSAFDTLLAALRSGGHPSALGMAREIERVLASALPAVPVAELAAYRDELANELSRRIRLGAPSHTYELGKLDGVTLVKSWFMRRFGMAMCEHEPQDPPPATLRTGEEP